jgi:hypothetical protein
MTDTVALTKRVLVGALVCSVRELLAEKRQHPFPPSEECLGPHRDRGDEVGARGREVLAGEPLDLVTIDHAEVLEDRRNCRESQCGKLPSASQRE